MWCATMCISRHFSLPQTLPIIIRQSSLLRFMHYIKCCHRCQRINSGKISVSASKQCASPSSFIQYSAQSALQDATKQLEAPSGTVVVLNARTGAIVAMAGNPSFDPNHYSDFADQKGCIGSEDVYFNPALFCGYEPGSTMKSV